MIKKLFSKYRLAIWGISIYDAKGPFHITNKRDKKNPVLTYKDVTDCDAQFIADPFMIKYEDLWYMFFEIYDEARQTGVIGMATSADGYDWKYDKVVLEEDFHLSYPYVFEYNGKIYMMPETGQSNYIKIYEAENFPYGWKCIKNIIEGEFLDSSLFSYDDKLWILTNKLSENKRSLSLFYSHNLMDGWIEHPQSPLIENDQRSMRPAGRVVVDDNKIIRYSQDGIDYYGKLIRAYEITKLTTTEYEEKELGIIGENSNIEDSWNKDGMHTIDMHKLKDKEWISVVDGHYFKDVNVVYQKLKYAFLSKFGKHKGRL